VPSVSAAAEELCVSHSAVSQQVKVLEGYFGQPLFRRSGRGIEGDEPNAVVDLFDSEPLSGEDDGGVLLQQSR